MKILFTVEHYDYLSGAPLYVYELTKELAKKGHEVHITSPNLGGALPGRSRDCGVHVHALEDIPDIEWDVLHLNQPDVSRRVLAHIPHVPAVSSIHSEWEYERPIINSRIRRFIAIRPSIKDKLISVDGIPEFLIDVIYNPIDKERFNRRKLNEDVLRMSTFPRDSILFVGTVDHLRKSAGLHLIEYGKRKDKNVVFVGKKFDTWLDGGLPKHVFWYPDRWDIETLVKQCDMTAGIMLGRTTIEGWCCGKDGIIYDVDLSGQIKTCAVHPAPSKMTLWDKFSGNKVAEKVERIYMDITQGYIKT